MRDSSNIMLILYMSSVSSVTMLKNIYIYISLQVVTTFELPGCIDMWTVIGEEKSPDEPARLEQENSHAFMILSREDSSMVRWSSSELCVFILSVKISVQSTAIYWWFPSVCRHYTF